MENLTTSIELNREFTGSGDERRSNTPDSSLGTETLATSSPKITGKPGVRDA